MHVDVIRTHCPVKETSQETFVENVMVGGVPHRMTFEKAVKWVQMSEAQASLYHGDALVRDVGSYNDFYGYLTCISADVSDADMAQAARRFHITRASTLELRLTCTVFLLPVVETEENAEFNRTRLPSQPAQYSRVPRNWWKELTEDGKAVTRVLDRVDLGHGTVWSSKNTPEENAALQAAFRQEWAFTEESPDASA
ncbi:class II SORL domain-containing protein [Cupriavidus pauculus]|uniref:class II SORL domain-containing protein n=1 Tax=Cupriavidus pauculus TaxID=82633 RepID=UPI001D0C91DA|nr:class II SORL domain-containing protein [Cupriavidus pauculus]